MTPEALEPARLRLEALVQGRVQRGYTCNCGGHTRPDTTADRVETYEHPDQILVHGKSAYAPAGPAEVVAASSDGMSKMCHTDLIPFSEAPTRSWITAYWFLLGCAQLFSVHAKERLPNGHSYLMNIEQILTEAELDEVAALLPPEFQRSKEAP